MPDPRKLAVDALENAGWDADDAAQAVADVEAAGVVFAAPVVGELREALARELADAQTDLSLTADPIDGAVFSEHDTYPLVDRLLPIIAAPVAERERALREVMDDLTDPDDCWYDHHGYCQAHGWTDTDPACPHARAKAIARGE